MKDSKDLARALRRHHSARLKQARRNFWGRSRFDWTARALGMVLSTPHPCSGICCGNQRRWFREGTMQERRAEQHSLTELLADVADQSTSD